MHITHTCNRQKVFSTGAASRILGIALLCLGGVSLSVEQAAAGRKGVGTLGLGTIGAGALILNELTKGTGKRKSATSQRSKRAVTTRNSKPSKQKEKTHDADDSVAASKKEPTENISTGSTSPSQAKAIVGTGGAGIISASDEIKAAQQHLRFMGYDIPQETGTMDTKTKSAVMQFQDSIGAPVTGDLTTDQLQMLFMKVASKKDAP